MADEEIRYSADHVLEYPYVRSVGPVIGAFLTGLRDGKVVGIRGTGGKVIVPPTEYDPQTKRVGHVNDIRHFVAVGDAP
jgi:hypothetical protein